MIDAIVFDFDGVIVDSEPLHWQAFQRIFEPLGMGFDYQRYLAEYVGFDDRDMFRRVFAEHDQPLDGGRMAGLIERKGEAFAAIVGDGVEALPGAAELIRNTSQQLPIAISSGALAADIAFILPAIGDDLMDCFRAIVTAGDVAQSKPDPASYRLAAERLGVAAKRCLAIEDTEAGLISAKDAGMHTLGVTNTCPADRLQHADRVVDTLEAVTIDQLNAWF
jgi:beta-phosphoglucomutase